LLDSTSDQQQREISHKETTMKSLVLAIVIPCLFFLASCKSVFQSPPLVEKTPDTLSKPTVTIVPKDTRTELPKGSWIKTDPNEKTTVTLEEDTVVKTKPVVQQEATEIMIKEESKEILLPKNTEVILPENTYLRTSDSTVVFLEGGSEVTLPQGTEITITRVNWYAIMFYCILVVFIVWYYLQGRCQPEDKDNDGFVDDPKVKKKKKV
jgi:hypothetical protein